MPKKRILFTGAERLEETTPEIVGAVLIELMSDSTVRVQRRGAADDIRNALAAAGMAVAVLAAENGEAAQ